jgi:NIMA (never in mitosis gene a)-related kinase
MPRGWIISKELGRGAFGRALLVKRRKDGLVAVLKEIALDGLPLSERKAAESEVSILKKLKRHPNIVAFMDSFLEDKKLHIVMEWAREGDLAVVIKTAKKNRSPLKEERILTIFFQCCAALNFMHSQHVLHRDIKPANIFLTRSGDQCDIVKLGDFGIAKVLAHTMARAKTVAGTPFYMAPELCQERPYTIAADCWSLGCVLHELCRLDVPFTATSMAALVRKIVSGRPKSLPFQYSA